MRRMLFSPFGYAMRAGRDSPLRAEAIGIDVKRVHWIAFAIAGTICGVAGGLFAFAKGIDLARDDCGRTLGRRPRHGAAGRHPDAGRAAGRRAGVRDPAGHHHAPDRVLARDARRASSCCWCWCSRAASSARSASGSTAQAGDRTAMNVLSVRALHKSFGGVRAVDDVSFDVEPGKFLALIGPNGAGKSTCFNMINGQLAPDGGEIRLAEHSIVGLKPRAIWRLGVGRTFQVAATFGSMTVVENVQLALASFHGELFHFVTPVRPPPPRARARTARPGRHGGRGRPCLQGARLWRRQARRAGDRARQRSAPAADGRADRRHGAARAQRPDRADQAAGDRARHLGAVHRALHGRGVRLRGPHHRAGARRADRRRATRGRSATTARSRRSISAPAS